MGSFIKDGKIDWNLFKYPTNGIGRDISFKIILNELSKINNPKIIEIGCIRSVNDWTAGNSSELFAWFVSKYGGEFYTVDTNANNMVLCSRIINKYRNNRCKINTIVQNGINFLESTDVVADFLYLDAMDTDKNHFIESSVVHYHMFKAYENKLKSGCIISIDDISDSEKFIGKGYVLIPYLLYELKYELLCEGYQFVFRKP